jgi:hypothetical protein
MEMKLVVMHEREVRAMVRDAVAEAQAQAAVKAELDRILRPPWYIRLCLRFAHRGPAANRVAEEVRSS